MRAATTYAPDTPAGIAIRRLKFDGVRPLARDLGRILAARYPFGPEVVLVPVPLHIERLRTRGYNQASLLAAQLGRERRFPVVRRALIRRDRTPAQSRLPADLRRTNLLHAVVPGDVAAVSGRRVVLIDDVLTTGATALACARALRAAGATAVDVYVLARTPAA